MVFMLILRLPKNDKYKLCFRPLLWWCFKKKAAAGAVCLFSRVWLFATLWTVAHQPPLSMGFPRQEYWSKLPFPPPRDLPDPVTQPEPPAHGFFIAEPPEKPRKRKGEYKSKTVQKSCGSIGQNYEKNIFWGTLLVGM